MAIKAARVRADLAFALTDALVVVGAYVVALAVRMIDPGVSDSYWSDLAALLPFLVFFHIAANVMAGAYGHVWEHASIAEARQVILSNLVMMALVGVYVVAQQSHPIPLSSLMLGTGITLGGMGLVRFRSRVFSYRKLALATSRPRALVVGTNRAAASFARESTGNVEVVGFVEKGPAHTDRWLAGLPILGSFDELVELVERLDVEQVVVAGGSDELVRLVVDTCLSIDVRLRILPDPAALMDNPGAAVDVRDIEVTDLLPRAEIKTDLLAVSELLRRKTVLVTGAGGSIGGEVVRQVAGFSPQRIFALDHDETLLHELLLGLGESGRDVVPVLADVRDASQVRREVFEIRPDVVFHAAALKHVPVLEAFPDEAHRTNVVGTVNLLAALRPVDVERFVLISTDKAVRPASAMGASKRIAEMIVQQEGARNDRGVFTSVRFGNVLGSRGSVVPTFIHQIKAGGPVTITDEHMTRFFMTVDEAVQLVLQSAALARGGEVFVLDMGEQVKIIDLARRMIRLAGLVPGRDLDIVVTGVRPGEKIEERLAHGEMYQTDHPKVRVTWPPSPGPVTMSDFVELLDTMAEAGDRQGLREGLRDLASHEWDGFETVSLEPVEDPVETAAPWT